MSGSFRLVYYMLNDDHSITETSDMYEWARWIESHPDRHVADQTFGHEGIGTIRVSTVFLGINHRFGGAGPPIVFETMIFGGGGDLDGYQDRCCTWDEAVLMHRRAVELVKNAFNALAEVSGA